MADLKLVKPELLMLVPVLNAFGTMLKKSKCGNHHIPFILGITSILLSSLYSLGNHGIQNVAFFLYENITQGLLIAAVSVYGHQMYCKNKKQHFRS